MPISRESRLLTPPPEVGEEKKHVPLKARVLDKEFPGFMGCPQNPLEYKSVEADWAVIQYDFVHFDINAVTYLDLALPYDLPMPATLIEDPTIFREVRHFHLKTNNPIDIQHFKMPKIYYFGLELHDAAWASPKIISQGDELYEQKSLMDGIAHPKELYWGVPCSDHVLRALLKRWTIRCTKLALVVSPWSENSGFDAVFFLAEFSLKQDYNTFYPVVGRDLDEVFFDYTKLSKIDEKRLLGRLDYLEKSRNKVTTFQVNVQFYPEMLKKEEEIEVNIKQEEEEVHIKQEDTS